MNIADTGMFECREEGVRGLNQTRWRSDSFTQRREHGLRESEGSGVFGLNVRWSEVVSPRDAS